MPTGASRTLARRADLSSLIVPVQAALIGVMVGVAEMGPIGTANDDAVTPIQSFAEYQALYGGFTANARDLPLAVKGFFDEAGENSGAQLFISRVVHYTTLGDPTTRTSATGSVDLLTAAFAATKGFVLSAVAGPYDLDPGVNTGAFSKTLKIKVNGGGAITATFTAGAASRESGAGTFNITNGQTFTISLQSGAVFTKQFLTASNEFPDYSAVTVAELVSSLNAFFLANGLGALATATSGGTKVTVTSLWRGSSSGVNIGGTASLGFTTGNIAGSGNIPNVHVVTVANAKTVIEAAVSGVTVNDVADALQIETNTLGDAGTIQVDATSQLYARFSLDTSPHQGLAGDPEATVTVTALWDGTYAGRLTVQVSAATNGDPERRDVQILRDGVPLAGEKWINVNLVLGDDAYLITAVNEGVPGQRKSKLVRMAYVGTLTAPNNLPDIGTSTALAGGADGLASLTDNDFVGGTSDNGATGLRVFDQLERIDEGAIPGRATASAQNGLVTYADVAREGNMFVLTGSAANATVAQHRTQVTSTSALKGLSSRLRMLYPRVLVDNPDKTVFGQSDTVEAPEEGVVMGMHARVSAKKVGGAFEQPAGVTDGFLRSVRGIATREAEDRNKRGLLQDDRVCVIRAPRNKVRYVDGTDTAKRNDPFPSVGASRGAILVANDLISAYDDQRQQNITEGLLDRLASAARVYLRKLMNAGCFATKVEKNAFLVDFGPSQNNAQTMEDEEVIGLIGLNTATPAKYITITIAKYRGLLQQFEAAA